MATTVQTFRGYNYAANYFQGDWVIAAPGGLQIGDLMVAFCTGNSISRGIDTLYPWYKIFDSNDLPLQSGRLQVFIKVADYTDPGATYRWPTDHYSFAGGIYAIANALPVFDRATFIQTNSYNDGYFHASPITPRGPNEMMIWLGGGIALGCDSRVPPSYGAYFQSYNGGGGHDVFCVSSGISPYPGVAATGSTWTDGVIYTQHSNVYLALFTFKTKFASRDSMYPLLFSGP